MYAGKTYTENKSKLLKILKGIKPEVDFENETALIENGLLDSFDVIQIINAVSDEFVVDISAAEVVPENFNSIQAIWDMIQRLSE